MGEFADDAIDQGLADFEADFDERDDYLCDNYLSGGYSPRRKMCRHCGMANLTWGKYNGKWRLFNGSELHSCLQLDNHQLKLDL
jgi:hypothetical protein